MLRDSRVLQAARDGGSGGGRSGGGAGLKAATRRRPGSQPHESDSEEDGEWEPGAYGLVDVPRKRSLYQPPAWMSGGNGAGAPARSGSPAARPAAPAAQQGSPALPPTPNCSTARQAPVAAGGGTSSGPRSSSGVSGRRPPQPSQQQRPGSSGLPFAFVSLVPSVNDPPQLRLFPGQLRAQSSKRLGTAAAPGALLVQRSDSNSSRASSQGGENGLVERCDSAAFGSEISFKGDE